MPDGIGGYERNRRSLDLHLSLMTLDVPTPGVIYVHSGSHGHVVRRQPVAFTPCVPTQWPRRTPRATVVPVGENDVAFRVYEHRPKLATRATRRLCEKETLPNTDVKVLVFHRMSLRKRSATWFAKFAYLRVFFTPRCIG